MSRCYDVTFEKYEGDKVVGLHHERGYGNTRDTAERSAAAAARRKGISVGRRTRITFVPSFLSDQERQ